MAAPEAPGLDGIDVCRKIREKDESNPTYIILLTARQDKEDIVAGLEAGANDYIVKPFDKNELRARIEVGRQVVNLQTALSEQVQELKKALAHVKTLQGIIPICMHCHKIRDDQQAWQGLERYIENHSEANFSHGICPDCMIKHHSEITLNSVKE